MQVNWTESAANQAKVILAGEEAGLNVRCFIQGGGCSGFQYGFTLDQQKEDDYVFETNGAKLLIDPMSGVYFNGATIDYKDDPLNGSMFIINNPKILCTVYFYTPQMCTHCVVLHSVCNLAPSV